MFSMCVFQSLLGFSNARFSVFQLVRNVFKRFRCAFQFFLMRSNILIRSAKNQRFSNVFGVFSICLWFNVCVFCLFSHFSFALFYVSQRFRFGVQIVLKVFQCFRCVFQNISWFSNKFCMYSNFKLHFPMFV